MYTKRRIHLPNFSYSEWEPLYDIKGRSLKQLTPVQNGTVDAVLLCSAPNLLNKAEVKDRRKLWEHMRGRQTVRHILYLSDALDFTAVKHLEDSMLSTLSATDAWKIKSVWLFWKPIFHTNYNLLTNWAGNDRLRATCHGTGCWHRTGRRVSIGLSTQRAVFSLMCSKRRSVL